MEFYFKHREEEQFSTIPTLKEGCWIHIEEALPSDIDYLCELTHLSYTDLQDSLDKYELPRIEKGPSHVLVFTRHPIELDAAVGLYTANLTILLTSSYFITISLQKNSLIRNFINRKNPLSTQEGSTLLIHLFLRIFQEFTSQIRKVRHNVMTQEKELINVESEEITTLTRNEEILNQYHASLEPNRQVLEGIVTGRFTPLNDRDQEILEDLLLTVEQSETLCSISIKSIRSLRDSYQIIFTNNLHKTIKLLTALTIILNIPTMIASIYGMNIPLPFAEKSHAFVLIFSSIILLSILSLLLFRRKKWL